MMEKSNGLNSGVALHGGTYRIERVLGQGSFGITYLATAKFVTEGNLGKMEVEAKVAIKEFFMSEVNSRHDDGSSVEGSSGSVFTNYRRKFRKEAENLSKLSHPNIVKVLDVFDENNTTYYVMEFLEGANVDDYIKEKGHLDEKEAIDIIKTVGKAVEYMHSRKMLHLDIKPRNIMHKSDGGYYLIDFGLSKQFSEGGEPESSTSIGLGTPGYAPIEQASYKQDGSFPATLDVYALGATLFKMLTGKRPPEATYILNDGFPDEDFKALNVSDHTLNVLRKSMAPMKKARYSTVREFLYALDGKGEEEKTIVANSEATVVTGAVIKEPEIKPEARRKTDVKTEKPHPYQPPIEKEEKPQKSNSWIWIGGGIVAAIILLIIFIPKGGSKVAMADSVQVESNTDDGSRWLNDWNYISPLGTINYNGEGRIIFHNDTFPDGTIKYGVWGDTIPDGKGIAKIIDGEFKGAVYDGYFKEGNFDGETKYVAANGDTFEGTFKNNKYSKGRYTIKSTGEYFEGWFDATGAPGKGQWYDKNGKPI